jgi:polysaccharide chain length determinant protein (PEP-CTERM system associated)
MHTDMQEVLTQIQAAARGMWKYRWLGVAVAWLVALVGTIAIFKIPDQYEASARIHVDTLSILKPLMAGLAVQPDIDQQIGMLSRTLISRPNVEKLVRMADLDLKNKSKSQQDEMVDELMKTLRIAGTGRDNLYVLSYRDTEAERAKRAIQSLVSIFIESGLGATRNDAASAKAFINDQIKSYQVKLEEAEARLKDFRLRNIDVQMGEGRDVATRLSEMSSQLEKAKLELREAENARDAAKSELASLQSRPAGSTGLPNLLQDTAVTVATPEIDARLDAQRRQLDALLQRFTEQHPDVLSTRRLVRDLEEQKRKEVQELRKAALAAPQIPSAGGGNSLAAQELNRMMAISEVQVAALKARVSEYAGRYNLVRASLKNAPQLEAEAAQLNRDYAIHKKNYEDLVARRESAAMSGDLDVASGMADFRLIDPPRVSPQPVFPNRPLLLPLALLAALAAGLFAAFAASQVRPVFFHPGEMRARFELPILGMVSSVLGDAEVRQRRVDRLRFFAASGGLVLLFAAGMTTLSLLASR